MNESEVTKIRPAHREFLDIGYNKGLFLASGPKIPKTGGTIIAKGDLNEIKELISSDPFHINNIAEYSYETFDAVKHISELG